MDWKVDEVAPKIDEIPEAELRAEIARRVKLREARLCDFCQQGSGSPSCKFPKRHLAGTCTHPNKVVQGRTPDRDIRYHCPDCRLDWWWP